MEALLLISTRNDCKEEVISGLIETSGILSAYTVFGPFDIVAIARVDDVRAFEQSLKSDFPGIELINALIPDNKEEVMLRPRLMGGII